MKFIHTADLHLGLLQPLGEAPGAKLYNSLFKTLDNIFDLAGETQSDLILMAGDFLENARFEEREFSRLCEIIHKNPKVALLIAAGNHDFYMPATNLYDGDLKVEKGDLTGVTAAEDFAKIRNADAANLSQRPFGFSAASRTDSYYDALMQHFSNVFVFPAGIISRLDLPELQSSVYGASFGYLHVKEPPLLPLPGEERLIFTGTFDGNDWSFALTFDWSKPPEIGQAPAALPNKIAIIHGDKVTEEAKESIYNPLKPCFLQNQELCYKALGHIHKREDVPSFAKLSSSPAMYPGSPQGLSFKEVGAHSVLYGEVANGSLQKLVARNVADFAIANIDVEVESKDSDTEIWNKIKQEIEALFGADFDRHVYVIKLHGQKPEGFAESIMANLLSDKLSNFKLEIDLKIVPDPELWRGQNNLIGYFVESVQEKIKLSRDPEEAAEWQEVLNVGLEEAERETRK